jgi:predicted nucleic acid-binding protein
VIHLDTSAVIAALGGTESAGAQLRQIIADGSRIGISSIVLYEWLRGPRRASELRAQDLLLPLAEVFPFGPGEAVIAARLYRGVRRPRGREVDLAIAACALSARASIWTLNADDFRDIPGLDLV